MQAIFEPATPNFTQIQADANNELQDLLDQLETESRQIQPANDCVDKYLSALREIIANAQAEIGQCVQTALDRVLDLKQKLEAKVANIVREVHDIQNVVAECRANGIVLKCLIDNVLNIRAFEVPFIDSLLNILSVSDSKALRVNKDNSFGSCYGRF